MTQKEYYKKIKSFDPEKKSELQKALSFIEKHKSDMYSDKEKVIYLSDVAMTHMRHGITKVV